MGEGNPEERIRNLLREKPRGLTISEIALNIGINRNSTAKYLKVLEAQGYLESFSAGTANCFFLPRRLPPSILLEITTDLVCIFDSSQCLTYANDYFLHFLGLNQEALNRNISEFISDSGNETALVGIFADLLDKEEQVREIIFQKDGNQVYLKAKTIPTTFDDGSRGTTIVCEDITKEKIHLKNLEFLARISVELADMRDDENIYQYIAERIAELEPVSHITVASITPETQTCVLKAFAGERGIVEEFQKTFGDPTETPFSIEKVPWALQFLSRGQLIQGPDSLYIQSFKKYPKDFCDEIQARLHLGKCYVMGCTCRGGLYGTIVIRLHKDAELRNSRTLEAFVKQAGVVLQRRHLREKLRKAEEKIAMLEAEVCTKSLEKG